MLLISISTVLLLPLTTALPYPNSSFSTDTNSLIALQRRVPASRPQVLCPPGLRFRSSACTSQPTPQSLTLICATSLIGGILTTIYTSCYPTELCASDILTPIPFPPYNARAAHCVTPGAGASFRVEPEGGNYDADVDSGSASSDSSEGISDSDPSSSVASCSVASSLKSAVFSWPNANLPASSQGSGVAGYAIEAVLTGTAMTAPLTASWLSVEAVRGATERPLFGNGVCGLSVGEEVLGQPAVCAGCGSVGLQPVPLGTGAVRVSWELGKGSVGGLGFLMGVVL